MQKGNWKKPDRKGRRKVKVGRVRISRQYNQEKDKLQPLVKVRHSVDAVVVHKADMLENESSSRSTVPVECIISALVEHIKHSSLLTEEEYSSVQIRIRSPIYYKYM